MSRIRALPVLLQAEIAECGVACIAMVANYWGHGVTLSSLRGRFGASLRGTSLQCLTDMAGRVGLQARPLRVALERLATLRTPCILHWDLNHYVVLARVSGDTIVIHDPAAGRRRLEMTDASKHFTGVVLDLAPGPDFVPLAPPPAAGVLTLLPTLAGLRHGLAIALVLALTLEAFALAPPFYLQSVVDRVLASGDRSELGLLAGAFLVLAGTRACFGALRAWTTAVLAARLNLRWLVDTFAHLMRLPLPFFEKRSAGDIVSRFASIQAMQQTLTTQFVDGIVDGLLATTALVVMCLYSPALAAIPCVAALCQVALRAGLFGSLRDAMTEQFVAAGRQHAHLWESLRAVASLRLSGRAETRTRTWATRLAEQFNAQTRAARLAIAFDSGRLLITGTERVVAIGVAALAVLDGTLTAGMMLAFVAYQDHFSQSVAGLIDRLFELKMLRLHAERVADMTGTPAEPAAPRRTASAVDRPPTIELRGVGFRYAEMEPFVVRDIDLVIPAGQCVAITGPSGGGKTTLIKLLLGLLPATEGEILVDGTSVEQLGWEEYRRGLGAVLQDESLFAGSIAENIALFDSTPDRVRVRQCAHLAAIDRDIQAMPMGYQTLVGDAGAGLSGGQRQRILLARALYKRPGLLVLDEATSHLDLATEQRVNAALGTMALTRIVVAHRPESIALAHRVVSLRGGSIDADSARVAPTALARDVC